MIKKCRGVIRRVRDFCELLYRRSRFINEPLYFSEVRRGEGKAIGKSIEVEHPSTHDMEPHVCCGALTTLVLTTGMRDKINAYWVVNYKQIAEYWRITTIQPCHVEAEAAT